MPPARQDPFAAKNLGTYMICGQHHSPKGGRIDENIIAHGSYALEVSDVVLQVLGPVRAVGLVEGVDLKQHSSKKAVRKETRRDTGWARAEEKGGRGAGAATSIDSRGGVQIYDKRRGGWAYVSIVLSKKGQAETCFVLE